MTDEVSGGQTNNTNLTIGIVVVLVVVVAIAAFILMRPTTSEVMEDTDTVGNGTDTLEGEIPAATPTVAPSTVPSLAPSAAASPVAGTVKAFTVAGSNFKFNPSEIRVKAGDTVQITLTNSSAMPHDWRVDAFNAATKTVQPGQTDMVQFVASKAGTYEYYCSVGNHRQMGMVGKLIVE